MYLDAYIGDIAETGYHDGDVDTITRTPCRVSPFFPTSSAFWLVNQKVERGELRGRQTDWAGWTAALTKAELLAFVEECYPPSESFGRSWMERMEHEAPAAWGEDANTIFAAYAEGGQAALDYLDGRGFQTWHDAHNYCRMRELREFIDALSPDSEYALVAAEL